MSKLTDNIDKARAASRERFETARDIANEGTVVAREKMSESKARAAALLGDGREKAKPKANLSAARDARSTKRQKPLIRRRRTPAATRLARWV